MISSAYKWFLDSTNDIIYFICVKFQIMEGLLLNIAKSNVHMALFFRWYLDIPPITPKVWTTSVRGDLNIGVSTVTRISKRTGQYTIPSIYTTYDGRWRRSYNGWSHATAPRGRLTGRAIHCHLDVSNGLATETSVMDNVMSGVSSRTGKETQFVDSDV